MPYKVTQGGMGERLPVAVGTGIWALLFVLGLTLRPELNSSERGWWIWTALAGIALGFVGDSYLVLRRPKPKPGEPIPPTTSTGDVDDVTRRSGEPTGLPKLRRRHPDTGKTIPSAIPEHSSDVPGPSIRKTPQPKI